MFSGRMQKVSFFFLLFPNVLHLVLAQGFVSLCTPNSPALGNLTLHSVAVISELKGDDACEMYALGQIELERTKCMEVQVNSDGSRRTFDCTYEVTNLAFINYFKTVDTSKFFLSRKIDPGKKIRATIYENLNSKVPTFIVTVDPIKTSHANCPHFTLDDHHSPPGGSEDFVAKVENALKKFVQEEIGRTMENLCCFQQATCPPPGPIGK